jgi:hypothetical protein
VVSYATGVYVRYSGIYDTASGQWLQTTVPHPANTPFAGTCYMGSVSYDAAGCDHFGVHLGFTAAAGKAVTTGYRWLIEDTANPGTLIPSPNNVFVPTPVYSWGVPATPTAPPVLVVEIQTPPPPPAQFGTATWMKVYKTEMATEVALGDLTSDNPIVPLTPAQIETEWALMQPIPPNVNGHKQRNKQTNSGGVGIGTRSVLRTYETYAYTGAYDPLTHEVICGGDGTCNVPQSGELGDLQIRQMTAVNVAVPSLSVTLTGSGSVSSSDKIIACGSKCSSIYALGTQLTLTAKPSSNSIFTGWTGACAGTSLTCVVTVNDSINAGAIFAAIPAGGGGGGATGGGGGGATGGGGGTVTQFTVSIGHSNTGTVTSDVTGINCGSTCSAKYNSGAVVTLTATPLVGKTFVNWTGACLGTVNTCTLTVNSNESVQAVFSK